MRDSALQRWWQLYTRLNQVEARAEAGRYDILRLYLEGRIRDDVPRLLFLPPGNLRGMEPGPPCEACGKILSDASWLAACTVCLTVFHRGCVDRPDRCALTACQDESWEPRPR